MNRLNNNCNQCNLAKRKENTLCSLQQVENFLCNFTKFIKTIKIYNFFKN